MPLVHRQYPEWRLKVLSVPPGLTFVECAIIGGPLTGEVENYHRATLLTDYDPEAA